MQMEGPPWGLSEKKLYCDRGNPCCLSLYKIQQSTVQGETIFTHICSSLWGLVLQTVQTTFPAIPILHKLNECACGKLVMCIGLAQAQIAGVLTMSYVDFLPQLIDGMLSVCAYGGLMHMTSLPCACSIRARRKQWLHRLN